MERQNPELDKSKSPYFKPPSPNETQRIEPGKVPRDRDMDAMFQRVAIEDAITKDELRRQIESATGQRVTVLDFEVLTGTNKVRVTLEIEGVKKKMDVEQEEGGTGGGLQN